MVAELTELYGLVSNKLFLQLLMLNPAPGATPFF
jgi:hypothetical protein